jgi:hypothetical protein
MKKTVPKTGGSITWVVIFLVGLTLGGAIPCAFGFQPHMVNALRLLRQARAQLIEAIPQKGGHRERAIELVDRAIVQVELGAEYAR